METRENCWEFKQCHREPGGMKVPELGECPAATDASCNGQNGGKNAGRICWAVAGTCCGGRVQGTTAQKELSCMTCDFFKKVESEEDFMKFTLMKPGQQI
mgnify:CR=1 FL=1